MKKIVSILIVLVMMFGLSTLVCADGDWEDLYIDGFHYGMAHWWSFEPGSLNGQVRIELWDFGGMKGVFSKEQISAPIPKTLYTYQILNHLSENFKNTYNVNINDPAWQPYLYETVEVMNNSILIYEQSSEVLVKAKRSNGEIKTFEFPDQKPVIINGRTMLPLRPIAEYYGWDLKWSADLSGNVSNVTVNNPAGYNLELNFYHPPIGSDYMYVNGKTKELDVPPVIINGRTMLPLRAIAEAMAMKVEWNESENCVYLSR